MSDDRMPHDEIDEPALDESVLAALEGRLTSDALWAGPPAELESRIVDAIGAEAARTTPQRTQPRWLRVVAAAFVLIGGVGLVAAVLTAGGDDGPEGEVFALGPTELAEGATGEVELAALRNGLRIILTVSDLPPAPEGQFYEAWLSREGGGVSAGTFHMRNRSGEIELWAGVTTDDYQRFVITIEDEDGDAGSSGRPVFLVDLHGS
ncbi:MAG: anti-sigma factor [Actinomycetota bacterium]